MKRIFILFILTLVSSVILFGCMPNTDNAQDGYINEDGEIVGGTENGENITENGTTVGEHTADGGKDSNADEAPDESSGENTDVNENNTPDEPEPPEVGNAVGNLFASISLEALDGTMVSPDDYRGKIVIVNIWATWCPPCKAELPDFHKIASEYKDDVVIIAAHTPNGNANAKAHVEQNFPETDIIFAYDTPYSDAYLAAGGVGYVPQTAIVDENGVIIYADSGLMTYEQLVAIIEGQLEI